MAFVIYSLLSEQTVISSAFESSLALSAYSHLALACQTLQPEQRHPAHGLGTSDWFASDIVSLPSLASRGTSAS